MKKLNQADKIYNLLLDGKSHRVDQIAKKVYGSETLIFPRIAARIYDIKQKYGVEIECKKDKKSKLSLYTMAVDN